MLDGIAVVQGPVGKFFAVMAIVVGRGQRR